MKLEGKLDMKGSAKELGEVLLFSDNHLIVLVDDLK